MYKFLTIPELEDIEPDDRVYYPEYYITNKFLVDDK